jgi:hypothetical protein
MNQLYLMVQQGTACRYPALLVKYSFCYYFVRINLKVIPRQAIDIL